MTDAEVTLLRPLCRVDHQLYHVESLDRMRKASWVALGGIEGEKGGSPARCTRPGEGDAQDVRGNVMS